MFLLYAYPCIAMGGQKWGRPEKAEKEFLALVDTGKDPTHALLKVCFPDAVSSFEDSAGMDHVADEDPWPVELVREFWRAHKGWKDVPTCAVMRGIVESIVVGDKFAMVNSGGNTTPAINRYGLAVKQGDTVYLHQHHIIEAEESV